MHLHYSTIYNKRPWHYAEDEGTKRLSGKIIRFVSIHWRYWLTMAVLVGLILLAWLQVGIARAGAESAKDTVLELRQQLLQQQRNIDESVSAIKRKLNARPHFTAGETPEPDDPLTHSIKGYCHAKLAQLEEEVQQVR